MKNHIYRRPTTSSAKLIVYLDRQQLFNLLLNSMQIKLIKLMLAMGYLNIATLNLYIQELKHGLLF